MALIVQKFGGTSVADPDRMRAVAEHVAFTKRHGNDVVVVVNNDDNRVPGVPPLAATGWDGAAGGRRFDGDRWTVAGSLATGSLRPREERRSGGAVRRLRDMSAIWRLLGGGGGRIVVHCCRDCHRRGGGGDHTTAREGGGAYPERTKEREGENDNVVTNNDDGGNALL